MSDPVHMLCHFPPGEEHLEGEPILSIQGWVNV